MDWRSQAAASRRVVLVVSGLTAITSVIVAVAFIAIRSAPTPMASVEMLAAAAGLGGASLAVGGSGATFLASRGRFLEVGTITVVANASVALTLMALPDRSYAILPLVFAGGLVLQSLPASVFLTRAPSHTRIGFDWREFANPASGGILSAFFYQGAVAALLILAAEVGPGTYSALMYGNKVDMVAFETITLTLSTIFFPMFVRHSVKGTTDLGPVFDATRLVVLMLAPFIAILAIGSDDIVRIVFSRQAFEPSAAAVTSNAIGVYAIALLPMALVEMTSKSLIAARRSREMVVPFAGGLVVNLISAFILGLGVGAKGLPWAFLIGIVACACLLWHRVFRTQSLACAVQVLTKPIASAGIAALPVVTLFALAHAQDWSGSATRLVAGGLLEFGLYAIAFRGLSRQRRDLGNSALYAASMPLDDVEVDP